MYTVSQDLSMQGTADHTMDHSVVLYCFVIYSVTRLKLRLWFILRHNLVADAVRSIGQIMHSVRTTAGVTKGKDLSVRLSFVKHHKTSDPPDVHSSLAFAPSGANRCFQSHMGGLLGFVLALSHKRACRREQNNERGHDWFINVVMNSQI